mmetsp:Transcript_5545/g.9926  ORF Transcript_5545/g.9926 Transcript_5545/m.9926 type:complete len:425 (+) Transcript_5545:476-1750(+)
MTLYGAMKDHIQALKQGYLTLLPMCDEAGRQIIYINKTAKSNPSTDEKIQLMWYLLHVAMQNPVVQKRGCVVLANARGGRLEGLDRRWASQAASFLDLDHASPIRIKMVHVCHVNAVFPLVAQAVKAILSQMPGKSFLLHNGSDERVLESLCEYGLPKHCVPTYLGGTFHVSTDAFVRDRLTIEGVTLESNANIAKSLSSNHDDDGGSNAKTREEVLGDLIYNSSHIAKTREDAKSRKLTPLTVTSQGHLPLTNTENNVTSQVQEAISADERDFIGVEYASSKSSLPNNDDTTAPPIPEKNLKHHSPQKKSQLKRKNNNDPPDNESKKSRATTTKAEKGQVTPTLTKHGRSGDPRMNRAVQAKVDNPDLSLVAALMEGGFVFNNLEAPGVKISTVTDAENVTIYQRRNQLLRRLRRIKGKASKT